MNTSHSIVKVGLLALLSATLWIGGAGRVGAQELDDDPTPRVEATPQPTPTVDFTGDELVNGTIRACAGGYDDHAATDPQGGDDFQYRAHTRQVEVTIEFDGKPLPNANFTLQFDGNKGHAPFGDGKTKTARLHQTNEPFDTAHPWSETLEMHSDENGKVPSIWVLSSDVINQPKLQAMFKGKPEGEPIKVGEIGCDFAAPEATRRFGVKDYVVEIDDGWVFNAGSLVTQQQTNTATSVKTIPAKVYLKFQQDQSKAKDSQYFWIYPDEDSRRVANTTLDADGDGLVDAKERERGEIRRPLNDDGNWAIVNGHKIRVRISLVINDEDVAVNEEDISSYCTLLDKNGNPVLFVDTTSSADGSAQLKIKSGPLIELAKSIHLEAEDVSIFSQ